MQNHEEEKSLCFVCKGRGMETHRYIRNDGVEVEEIIECLACAGAGRIGRRVKSSPLPITCNEKTNLFFESLQIEETDI